MNTHESYVVPGTGMFWGYLQALPKDYDPNGSYPLVIFLHGSGECGNGTTELDRVAIHGYPMHAEKGREYPFILISPQLPEGKFWCSYVESLERLLDHLMDTLPVDPKRVYLTGLSNGGTGTYLWGQTSPERFAALLPVCGAGIVWQTYKLASTPLWAFHGDQDTAISFEESVRMVEGINARGGNAKLTIYPGVGHNCWVHVYDDPEVLAWMLEQHLN